MLLLMTGADTATDCNSQFNQASFLGHEFEEVLGVLENPASCFQSLSLSPIRWGDSLFIFSRQRIIRLQACLEACLAASDIMLGWCADCLVEDGHSNDRVGVESIDHPSDSVFIAYARFVTSRTHRRHGTRVRHSD